MSLGSVVSRQSVNSRFDENESELGVYIAPAISLSSLAYVGEWERGGEGLTFVVSVSLEVLSDGDGLLDEVVEILGEFGGETFGCEDYQQGALG